MIHWLVRHRLVASLIALLIIVGGLHVSPFAWNLSFPQNPVAVDALPDLGENQQIVFTEWAGRSPQDVEEQVSYPLSAALMGVPGVRDVRSVSMFGFSTISVIFEENIEFYWSRTRILEKLSSLPANTLPSGVQPTLGPDATGLGQVFWYTLEGRDRQGNPGGWDGNLERNSHFKTWDYALTPLRQALESTNLLNRRLCVISDRYHPRASGRRRRTKYNH